MSIQGLAGLKVAPLTRPLSENPVDTAIQRPPEAVDPQFPAVPVPDREQRAELDQVVEKMNRAVEIYNYDLKFEIVERNRIVIRVVNTTTGEIVRQIPPEDLLRAFRQMDESLGVLMDSKV